MKRMVSKKSHSWWWDSHISPKNSKWLAENLEEMDRCVKEMLKLIEEEGDSFAKKAEMYYQKRPELIAHVEDFYRMYRALAERYDHVTGELRRNIQSELHSQGSGSGSEFGSEPPSPSQLPSSFDRTPEPKLAIPRPSPRAAGFDFFLGSGGSSDRSRKGSDGFSSSSESDSDSDDAKENGDGDGISSVLHQRILELENELCIMKEKLREHEQCGQLANGNHVDFNSTILALENDFAAANEKLRVSEAEIISLHQKLKEKNLSSEGMSVELSYENMVELETRVIVLETEIRDHEREIGDLKGVVSASDLTIQQYKTQLADSSDKFLQEKSHLEANVVNLEGVIEELKAEVRRISLEKSQLETSILEQQHLIEDLKATTAISSDRFLLEKSLLEAKISVFSESNGSLEARLWQMEADKEEVCAEKDRQIAELNRNLDALKLKVDMLISEKDDLGTRVSALNDKIKCRDDRVRSMDEHLHQLHLQHVKLIAEIEEERRAGGELSERVKELEDEVERQRVAISDGAEGKREAIRQLCFSLEHYRDGYYHLRQMLQGHNKRPLTVMAI